MILLATSLALGFVAVLVGTPFARQYLLMSGIFGIDQQKPEKPRLATSGGLPVIFGFLISVTTYIALTAFFSSPGINLAETLAALTSVILISMIGFIDDIHVNMKAVIEEELDIEKEEFELDFHREIENAELPHFRIWNRLSGEKDGDTIRQGLGQVSKMLFVLPAALPLIAVGAGSWTMHFPIIGTVNWGMIYPLVLLPLGLLFVSNVVNMLEGMNGLAAAMSIVSSTSLGIYAYINGSIEAALIAFSLSACLLGFLKYNFYPASILPGDSLTYLSGAAMFSAMVVGDMERFGVFIFMPWAAEFLLKLRSGFQARSWGELQEDGSLKPFHDKNYSLTHPLMRQGLKEREIVLALAGVETLICVTGLYLFTAGII